MKKHIAALLAVLVLVPALLAGCGSTPIESYEGVWRYEDYDEDMRALTLDATNKLPVQLVFTADGYMYLVRSQPATDIGVVTDVFSYRYMVADGRLSFEAVEREGVDEPVGTVYAAPAVYPEVSISQSGKGLKVTVNDPSLAYAKKTSYTLYSTCGAVPYGYSDADRAEKQARVEEIRAGIAQCAQNLGRALGLSVLELGSGGWPANDIRYAAAFQAGGVQFVLTSAQVAYPSYGGAWYVYAGSGLGASWPVAVNGDYALLLPETADMAPGGTGVPDGWVEVFLAL